MVKITTLTSGWRCCSRRAAPRPFEQGHADIEDGQVRAQLLAQGQGLLAIPGLPHHLELRVARQQGDEAGAGDFMIVRQDQAYHRCHTACSRGGGRGTRARIRVPLPGRLWQVKRPPSKWARSCMATWPNCSMPWPDAGWKPAPSSLMPSTAWPASRARFRLTLWARACLRMLLMASWAMRNRAISRAAGRRSG